MSEALPVTVKGVSCPCGAPATVAVVLIFPGRPQTFGFCPEHVGQLTERRDLMAQLSGRSNLVTGFTERRLRQIADPSP